MNPPAGLPSTYLALCFVSLLLQIWRGLTVTCFGAKRLDQSENISLAIGSRAGIHSQLFAPYQASQVKAQPSLVFPCSGDAEQEDTPTIGEAWLLAS